MSYYSYLSTAYYTSGQGQEQGGQEPPDTGHYGSARFQPNQMSYLSYTPTNGFAIGTGDFTVEWFQWTVNENPFARIFQQGNYGSGNVTFGASIEGPSIIFWYNNNSLESFNITAELNAWTHYAIVRNSGVLNVYENGASIGSVNGFNYNFSSLDDLVLGQDINGGSMTVFDGCISNFRIVKSAVYTGNFTPPSAPLTSIANTVFLLTFSDSLDDDGPLSLIVNSNYGPNNVTLSSSPWPE